MNNLIQSERGSVVVEFALTAPLMLLLMFVLVESARLIYQASVIEKHLYAASELAAHSSVPISGDSLTRIINMAKHGTVDTNGDYVVPGWGNGAAHIAVVTSYYDLNGEPVPVVTLNTTVPYEPILPELAGFFGLADVTMEHSHAQVMH